MSLRPSWQVARHLTYNPLVTWLPPLRGTYTRNKLSPRLPPNYKVGRTPKIRAYIVAMGLGVRSNQIPA